MAIAADGTVYIPVHVHTVRRTERRAYTTPIARPVAGTPEGRGGVTIIERCACGAYRQTNRNGRAFESSDWRGTSALMRWAHRAEVRE